MSDTNMSDAEAKKEFEDIQAEIAKEKGFEIPEKKEEKEELDSTPKDNPKEDTAEEAEIDEEEEIEPQERKISDHKIPLSKHQEIKKKLEEEGRLKDQKALELQQQVEKLTEDLNRATTSKSMAEKVKNFSEKSGMDEQAAMELVQLLMDEVKPTADPLEKQKIEKVEIFLKKQDAEEKFQSELSDFIEDTPEAKDFAEKIRAEAFKKENLDKSLYEIYHRFVKIEDAPPKRKTGESKGPTRQNNSQGLDVSKVIEKINSGTAKPFEGLTEAQIDEVFSAMDKTGSRYIKR